ncbi:MAG: hypothetical protein QOH10_842 [Actinomycetota bacterium]|nr:hypothetical protein [Actinomycetota bacterium]
MTALVVVETIVLVLLVVVVTGLLRSHGEILRRLHALGAGLDPDAVEAPVVLRPRGDLARDGSDLGQATDIGGAGLHDDAVSIPVVGVRHRTLLAFLSSGCLTCRGFWDAFGRPATLGLPADVRLVVVTKDAAEESVRVLRDLAAADLAVVMSNVAWEPYAVPGSPYFTLVDGASARVVGEGTGATWAQVQSLLVHATGDEDSHRGGSGGGAAATEARIDLELLAQGIGPGDPRLYGNDVVAPDVSA